MPEYRTEYREPARTLAPHRGTLILVLGIIGLTVCGPLGVVAWVMGRGDLKQMKRGEMDPAGTGTTTGGMVCGIIATAFFALSCLIAVAVLIIFGAAALAGR